MYKKSIWLETSARCCILTTLTRSTERLFKNLIKKKDINHQQNINFRIRGIKRLLEIPFHQY